MRVLDPTPPHVAPTANVQGVQHGICDLTAIWHAPGFYMNIGDLRRVISFGYAYKHAK
jgi:hypothetical protein